MTTAGGVLDRWDWLSWRLASRGWKRSLHFAQRRHGTHYWRLRYCPCKNHREEKVQCKIMLIDLSGCCDLLCLQIITQVLWNQGLPSSALMIHFRSNRFEIIIDWHISIVRLISRSLAAIHIFKIQTLSDVPASLSLFIGIHSPCRTCSQRDAFSSETV